MGSKKNKRKSKPQQEMTIPNAATIIPSSSDATERTREAGTAREGAGSKQS